MEQAGLRIAIFQQEGRGVQSQANTNLTGAGRGRESAWIFQPIGQFTLRQDRNTVHQVTTPVDIVTAASPDALEADVVSTASRDNEAGGADLVTTVRDNDQTSYQFHIGWHAEEYWGSGSLGAAIIESFAEDNATFRFGVELISDSFDALEPNGRDPGPVVTRFTSSFNASLSQLLSPTTIVSGSYSFTAQFGHLETTYNSVPTATGERVADRFPRRRGRHTIGAEIRQAIPDTQTYFALDYRFYADSFQATAHTSRLTMTQYIGDVWLRGHYRFHIQEAPSFWMEVAPADLPHWMPRTGDSDLEDLYANEVGLNLRWFTNPRGAREWSSSFLEIGYLYYWRSNSLHSHLAHLEVGLQF